MRQGILQPLQHLQLSRSATLWMRSRRAMSSAVSSKTQEVCYLSPHAQCSNTFWLTLIFFLFFLEQYIDLENRCGAMNYAPVPVVLSKGEGAIVWDVDGNKYYDYLSAYSAVNQVCVNKG